MQKYLVIHHWIICINKNRHYFVEKHEIMHEIFAYKNGARDRFVACQ